jgi:dynein heavy chain
MHERNPDNKKYFNTKSNTLNPKSISMGELYGEVDVYTAEWHDGLASSIIRNANSDVQEVI